MTVTACFRSIFGSSLGRQRRWAQHGKNAMRLHDIEVDEAELASLCRRHGVSRLWLYGSVTRNDFRPDSDVDVLLDLEQPIGLFGLGGLQQELTRLFGRETHVTTLGSVPEGEQSRLLISARLGYAA
jgi:uncharacterized protein